MGVVFFREKFPADYLPLYVPAGVGLHLEVLGHVDEHPGVGIGFCFYGRLQSINSHIIFSAVPLLIPEHSLKHNIRRSEGNLRHCSLREHGPTIMRLSAKLAVLSLVAAVSAQLDGLSSRGKSAFGLEHKPESRVARNVLEGKSEGYCSVSPIRL